MPEKLRPVENLTIGRLNPAQVKMESIVEFGPGQFGGGVSCICDCICDCICNCICDCICDCISIGVTGLPVMVAYDVVYERIGEVNVEFGEQTNTQARMIISMDREVYAQMKEKDKLLEVGTAKSGAKQYLLKRTSNRRTK